MPNLGMFPLQGTLVNNTTTAVTTNGTSAALTLPYCDSYRFLVEVNTVSGTTPTLQVLIATSADGGTVFQEVLSFSQCTTSGLGRQMLIRPYLGFGDTATEAQAGVLGTADTASSVVAQNGPIDPRYIKVRWVIGGTTPSFAWSLKWIGQPPDPSS